MQLYADRAMSQVLDLAVSPSGKYLLASTDNDRVIMMPVGKVDRHNSVAFAVLNSNIVASTMT